MEHTLPEVALLWKPKFPQSSVFFNIPVGDRRNARVQVFSRVGKSFEVEVIEPDVSWLRIDYSKNEPRIGSSRFENLEIDFSAAKKWPLPLDMNIQVDTADLQPSRQYSCKIIFKVLGEIVWRELVIISTELEKRQR